MLGSLENISKSSNCKVCLELDEFNFKAEVASISKEFEIEPLNLFLFWGDWQIISSVKKAMWNEFSSFCKKNYIEFTRLGYAIEGVPSICSLENGKTREKKFVRNENFKSTGFSINKNSNIDYLLRTNLFV